VHDRWGESIAYQLEMNFKGNLKPLLIFSAAFKICFKIEYTNTASKFIQTIIPNMKVLSVLKSIIFLV